MAKPPRRKFGTGQMAMKAPLRGSHLAGKAEVIIVVGSKEAACHNDAVPQFRGMRFINEFNGMKSVSLALAGLLSVAPASAVLAQGFDTAYVESFIERYDINADGWLSGSELNACGCSHFDLDQDKAVSLAEFAGGLIIHGEASLAQGETPATPPPAVREVQDSQTAESDAAVPVAVAAAGSTMTYVNEPEGLSGDLAAAFVPFAFEYPADWKVVETGREPGASNFVKVEREVDGFTAENFAVGHLTLPKSAADDPAALAPVIEALQGMLANGFPNFQPIMTGPTELDGHEGRFLTFTSRVDETPQGPMEIWGRVLVIPADSTRGILALMLATRVGTELRGPADVALKGELPVIIKSFRFGNAG